MLNQFRINSALALLQGAVQDLEIAKLEESEPNHQLATAISHARWAENYLEGAIKSEQKDVQAH